MLGKMVCDICSHLCSVNIRKGVHFFSPEGFERREKKEA